jgi:hypothetical protein
MTTKLDGATIADHWWELAYDRWLASQDVPVHTGHYVQDLRTLERGWCHRGSCLGNSTGANNPSFSDGLGGGYLCGRGPGTHICVG